MKSMMNDVGMMKECPRRSWGVNLPWESIVNPFKGMKEDINDGKRAKVYSQEWYPANAEANASSISDLMSLASPDRSV